MKRVLLKNKKTGKIGELSGVNRIIVYEPEMPFCGNSILGEYDTLAKLNEEWEDYKPIEPLIKDEKIRKAVRAWAEANKIAPQDTIRFDAFRHSLRWVNTAIEFNESKALSDLEEVDYTIAELCGDEEE